MNNFYVTFGQKDKARKDGWIRLAGSIDRDDAHDFAMKEFNRDFSMLYNHEDFKPEYFPKGELASYHIGGRLNYLRTMFPRAASEPDKECDICNGTGGIEQIKGRTDIPTAPCSCIFREAKPAA